MLLNLPSQTEEPNTNSNLTALFTQARPDSDDARDGDMAPNNDDAQDGNTALDYNNNDTQGDDTTHNSDDI